MKRRNRKKVSNNISISSNLTQNVIIPDQINVESEVTSIEIKRDTQPNQKRDKILNTMRNYISLSNNDQLLHELQGKFECSKCKKMFIKNKKLVKEIYTCINCNQIICSECSGVNHLHELLEYSENYLNKLLSDKSKELDFTEMSFESYNVAISIMKFDIKNEFKNLGLHVLTCSLCIIAAINDGILHRCILKSFPICYNLLESSKIFNEANELINKTEELD